MHGDELVQRFVEHETRRVCEPRLARRRPPERDKHLLDREGSLPGGPSGLERIPLIIREPPSIRLVEQSPRGFETVEIHVEIAIARHSLQARDDPSTCRPRKQAGDLPAVNEGGGVPDLQIVPGGSVLEKKGRSGLATGCGDADRQARELEFSEVVCRDPDLRVVDQTTDQRRDHADAEPPEVMPSPIVESLVQLPGIVGFLFRSSKHLM